ncbi:GIY-YIG nuclease family protein [Candidatus Saccharibacteria bacterium]|nr:GIY-YIG nuclease family protein [Candidatus Saccharibacteria bacterium]
MIQAKTHQSVAYSVYIVRCADDTFYTGIARDINKRIADHNAKQMGRGAKYTRGRQPVRLVYSRLLESRSAALIEEVRIKKLSRAQKKKLIKSENY